jgi:2-oxoglutarate ferredoxin oxidoreductase subunit gamma
MKKKKMIERIICAGFGGQGIMAMGKVIALAALRQGQHVSWLPSYGAEVRGGTAHCMVVISDEEIASPCIEKADSLIVFNTPSLKKFSGVLRKRGLLLVNSSMVDCREAYPEMDVMKVPFTDMAVKLGFEKAANTIAVGAYLSKNPIVPLAVMERCIEEILAYKEHLIQINMRALAEGFDCVLKKD